jgi:1,4-dihydroxy-2-naphthoate polyprenyltransferase
MDGCISRSNKTKIKTCLIHRSTIQLLRFHFSLFLLPVYLFALSQAPEIEVVPALLVFIIWHLLVYPSSNGYNSYMDRDETPVGGLKKPLQPTRQLFYFSVGMDILAILLSLYISYWFALGILVYILVSRAYSYRGIRLKKYPVIGFLTVAIFQGAHVFYFTSHAVDPGLSMNINWLPALISSCLIGALYPLTQVYQHKEDLEDGVRTISYVLGKRGSFLLSMLLFLSASFLMYVLFRQNDQLNFFLYYLLIMFPVVSFFLYWMSRVWVHEGAADFKNSMIMNSLATLCTTLFFLLIIIFKH